MKLNIEFVRSNFPSLAGEWTYFDNAGGSQTVKQVGERIQEYLYNTNVQLGASYDISRIAGERVFEAQRVWAQMINAKDPCEIVFGPSTTMLLQNLSRSLVQLLKPGDEVIVTNCDHEANIGPWVNMEGRMEKGEWRREKGEWRRENGEWRRENGEGRRENGEGRRENGEWRRENGEGRLEKERIRVKWWKVNPETLELDLEDLKKLMTERTRLVAFTHASNILGTINPVKEITRFIHDHGAMVCVDGVAYAPHRLVDVQDLDVDFYAFSFYKVYGPHYSLLYGKKEILEKLPGINHYFIGMDETPYKLQPGNANFEMSYGTLGVVDYFGEVSKDHNLETGARGMEHGARLFDLIAEHEEEISLPFIDFLRSKPNVRIIGKETADLDVRVPTISFVVDGVKSSSIPIQVDKHKIGIRYGDFYARRLIEDLGLAERDGVIRVSMVHYNTLEEVNALIKVLDSIL